MGKYSIGDRFIFCNTVLNIEEECTVVAVLGPQHLELLSDSGAFLDAIQGFNDKQFIHITNL